MQDSWKHCSAFQSTTGQRIHCKKHESAWILGGRGNLFACRSKRMYFPPKYLCTSYVLLYEWCISGKKHLEYLDNELIMNATDMTRAVLIHTYSISFSFLWEKTWQYSFFCIDDQRAPKFKKRFSNFGTLSLMNHRSINHR